MSDCLKSCLTAFVAIAFMLYLILFFVLLLIGYFAELLAPDMVARGFTDLGEGWWGVIAWALRVPGVAFALLALPIAWLAPLVLQFRSQKSKMPQKRPPTDLPAAAVTILEVGVVTSRTLLTIILEMCQRGTLEITGVREAPHRSKSGAFDYRGSTSTG